MRPSAILLLYRARLRYGLVRELFAIFGLAVGVSLLFASHVASTSLDSSVSALTRSIAGEVRFQLIARSPEGFDERLLASVRRLPSVQLAEPVLEQRTEAIGPRGHRSVELIGIEPSAVRIAGAIAQPQTRALSNLNAIALPRPIARSVGVGWLAPLTLALGSERHQALLGGELLASESPALAASPIALAPLRYAQRLAGMNARLTRIFVKPRPGDASLLASQLRSLAANRLNVGPADFEARVFAQAAAPTNQSTDLFSALSALVGFLFAFNAMLLTAGQRRDFIRELRLDGASRSQALTLLLFDAFILGLFGSLLGLALGDLLSAHLFHADPGYLTLAFPIGSQRIVTLQSVSFAVLGAFLAALCGVLVPLRQLFAAASLSLSESSSPERPSSSGAGSASLGRLARLSLRVRTHTRPLALLIAFACLCFTVFILLAAPNSAIVGMALLALGLLLALPSLLDMIVAVLASVQFRLAGASAFLALVELRNPSNRSRSIAVAATGALAVFGSVAIQGAHGSLSQGLDSASHDANATAKLWVSPSGYSNLLATTPFRDIDSDLLSQLPGVAAVRVYRGGFLDIGARRVWVLAPPRTAPSIVPPSQVAAADLPLATSRIRAGGWAVVSRAVVAQLGAHIGQAFTLPSPNPIVLRVAALGTNIGWAPGAIVINAQDYARAWASSDASAYQLVPARGASLSAIRSAAIRALGPHSGLAVETAAQRELRGRQASRQGLSRLTVLAQLVSLAALLAMAAAMGAMIWQRRPRLAEMKLDGYARATLWLSLVLESLLLLGAGCAIGACFGLLGQALLSHALAAVTGFPVVESLNATVALISISLLTGAAVLIIAVHGYLAAGVRADLALQE